MAVRQRKINSSELADLETLNQAIKRAKQGNAGIRTQAKQSAANRGMGKNAGEHARTEELLARNQGRAIQDANTSLAINRQGLNDQTEREKAQRAFEALMQGRQQRHETSLQGGQLGFDRERLALDTMLGQGQLGIQQGRLGLDTEIGRGRLGLDTELGRGQLGVAQGGLQLEGARLAQQGDQFNRNLQFQGGENAANRNLQAGMQQNELQMRRYQIESEMQNAAANRDSDTYNNLANIRAQLLQQENQFAFQGGQADLNRRFQSDFANQQYNLDSALSAQGAEQQGGLQAQGIEGQLAVARQNAVTQAFLQDVQNRWGIVSQQLDFEGRGVLQQYQNAFAQMMSGQEFNQNIYLTELSAALQREAERRQSGGFGGFLSGVLGVAAPIIGGMLGGPPGAVAGAAITNGDNAAG